SPPPPRPSHSLDLPLELDARGLAPAPAHLLAERLDVCGARVAAIDEEVAVHLRHLRVADGEPAAARRVDQLPRLVAGRVLERGAAGAALDRLRRLARLGDLVHLGGDLVRLARAPRKERLGEAH